MKLSKDWPSFCSSRMPLVRSRHSRSVLSTISLHKLMISEQRSEGRLQAAKEHFVDALSSQNLHEVEAQFRYTIKGSTKMAEYDPMPELLALKVIVQFLLSEKVSEFKDENAAVFEISKACSEVISKSSVGAPDPERIKQSALRHIDDMFMSLKPALK
jgi:hypothetical protein